MDRRSFIRIMGVGLAAVTLTSTLSSCSTNGEKFDYGWNGPSDSESDIRLKLIAYAILCPNPHNKQPWLIKLTNPHSLDLYVDQTRLLPETDPFARQIHIGQGCFLETLAIAASGLGYQADIKYFPEGEYGNTSIEDRPVARVSLTKRPDMRVDPLFKQLLHRQSNKRAYDNSHLSLAQKQQLQALPMAAKTTLTLQDSVTESSYLQQLLTEAVAIESRDKARDLETIKMFRFNDQEMQTYRDGFGLEHTGVSGVKKMLIEGFIFDREKTEQDPTEFAKESLDIARTISESTSSFAWITTQGNSRLQQVKAGRDYCRLNLTTTAMGSQ